MLVTISTKYVPFFSFWSGSLNATTNLNFPSYSQTLSFDSLLDGYTCFIFSRFRLSELQLSAESLSSLSAECNASRVCVLDVQANGYRSPSEARWGSTRSTTWTKPWTSSPARGSSWSPSEPRVSTPRTHIVTGVFCHSVTQEGFVFLCQPLMWGFSCSLTINKKNLTPAVDPARSAQLTHSCHRCLPSLAVAIFKERRADLLCQWLWCWSPCYIWNARISLKQ